MADILKRRVKYAGDVLAALQHKAGMEMLCACDLLNNIPDADVAPVVHARWEHTTEPLGWQEVECVECSVCRESWIADEEIGFDFLTFWKYCPNCGAKMDAAAVCSQTVSGIDLVDEDGEPV